MLIKVIGSLVIILSLSFCGISSASKLKKRVEYLRVMEEALEIIKSEILYNKSSIYEIFEKLNKNNYFKEIGIFGDLNKYLLNGQSVEDGWSLAVTNGKLYFILNEDEIGYLCKFGNWLGGGCIDDQVSNINFALLELRRKIKLANSDEDKYYKIYSSFGLLFGLAVVILIW